MGWLYRQSDCSESAHDTVVGGSRSGLPGISSANFEKSTEAMGTGDAIAGGGTWRGWRNRVIAKQTPAGYFWQSIRRSIEERQKFQGGKSDNDG